MEEKLLEVVAELRASAVTAVPELPSPIHWHIVGGLCDNSWD